MIDGINKVQRHSTSRAQGKKSSPTNGFTPLPARREKTVGFVLNSGAA